MARILNMVKPRNKKTRHFTFSSEIVNNQFKRLLESIPGYQLTAEYDERMDKPDIILKQDNTVMGKIHLLLSDRPDVGKKEKYYIKIFLFQFKDQELFNQLKSRIIDFFNKLSSSPNNQHSITRKHKKRIFSIRSNRNKPMKSRRRRGNMKYN
jgi:hypothetical protein